MADKRNPLAGLKPPTRYTDTLGGKKSTTDNRDRPMTYRIGEDLIERINEAAEEYNVEKSGLVKVLLVYSLDALEAGELELPLKPKPQKLDI